MKNQIFILTTIVIASMFYSCTDLDVLPYNQFTRESFYENREQVEQAVFRPYQQMASCLAIGCGTGVWRTGGLVSDEIIWPQKGRHGYDGGDWGRLHYHSWSHMVDEGQIRGLWNNFYTAIGYINFVLEDFEERIDFKALGIEEAVRKEWEGQLRALRALAHMNLMCFWGGVPITTKVDQTPSSPERNTVAEVFNFVESECLAILSGNMLPELTRARGGKMTRAGVLAILVDLYLNAQEWTGTARWDDCIKFADYLITGTSPYGATGALNGGTVPQLDVNIDNTYAANNLTVSTEALFQFAFDRANGRWMARADFGGYRERDIVGNDYGGNNGIVVQAGAFYRYKDTDLRKHSWFMYGIDGDPVYGNYGGYQQWKGPYNNIGPGSGRQNMGRWVTGQEEFRDMPIIFCYRPITARYIVTGTQTGTGDDVYSGRSIEFTHWFAPEFPEDHHRDRILEACNVSTWTASNTVGKSTRELLMDDWDKATAAERTGGIVVNFSGSTNTRDGFQFKADPASADFETRLADYRFMWQCAAENTGARYNKYKIGVSSGQAIGGTHPVPALPVTSGNGNNHFILYRLTYVLFAKAEALMRKNGNVATEEVVDLINQCKERAFLPEYWASADAVTDGNRYTVGNFTMEEFLDERGREFIYEGFRRRDLIRFDKFEYGIPWWDANWNYPSFGSFVNTGPYVNGSAGTLVRDKSRRLFPIPYRQMENNPNLKQNPGYE